jgi:hypothetical protein
MLILHQYDKVFRDRGCIGICVKSTKKRGGQVEKCLPMDCGTLV